MPHTSRRARSSKSNPKRAVQQLDDGWSRVEYVYRASDGGTNMTQFKLPPQDPDLTIEKMQAEHERVKDKWVASEHRKKVLDVLEQKRSGKEWDVAKAVCVALGSLSVNYHTRIRSVYQFAFFMDVLSIIQANCKHENIKVFAQEPRFTELDKQFLTSLNVTVLENPAAEAEVGDDSFVFIPHLEWNAEIPYLQQGKRAPLYITSSATWIYEEAERIKQADTSQRAKESVDAMAAVTDLRANHHEFRVSEDMQMVDSLGFSYYIVKDKDEVEDDLTASVENLTV